MKQGKEGKERKESLAEIIVPDLKNLVAVLIATIIGMKIVFYKESIGIILGFTLSLFWLFVLPGLALMYYWHDKLKFGERLIVGTALSAALIGTLSYYTGLLGIHSRTHGIILPLLLIAIGVIGLLLRSRSKKE